MKKRIIGIVLALFLMGNMTAFAQTSYTDVHESDYFYVNVLFATEKGIINGVGDNKFDPYAELTVAQAIKISACIHANFFQTEINPYDNPNHWADRYYDYAVENGIIKQDEFSKSEFDNTITKDKLFYIFANTLPESEYIQINDEQLSPEQPMADYIQKLFCAGIITGSENGFDLENTITRADSVVIVSRMAAYSQRQFVE